MEWIIIISNDDDAADDRCKNVCTDITLPFSVPFQS